jgi:ATP-dependent DNA helicase RecG
MLQSQLSYDSELVHDKPFSLEKMQSLSSFFKEKTDEEFTLAAAQKLNLCREYQGTLYPTIAGVLFSDNDLRETLFPYAKVECALFKGNDSSHFLDQKTIDLPLALQPEETLDFVKRHINESGIIEGVYTVRRWEFPLKAIREVIRNAVVHRDYSLRGKDIKVAVYKDMVEITSPGRLLPSIDYGIPATRQSDIRNKVIAPVFRKTGLIDQWGNGLKIIFDEMKNYPEIEFRWKEAGMGFQVQFAKREPGSYPENENTRGTAEEPNITRYGSATEGYWQIL